MKENTLISNLPIYPHLTEICTTLKSSESRFIVLTAETGAGKSTALPYALLEAFTGKILMLEPRKLAVIAIANRISEIMGEAIGNTVGYRMHLESFCSSRTRLEIITEAILTRMIQTDPELKGINVIILDEFHERSIHTDLAIALLKEVMELRDDLYVVVMSATINTKELSEYLGNDKQCPVINIPGKLYPISIEYSQTEIVACICNEINNIDYENTILVFLPGIKDLSRCYNEILNKGLNSETEIYILHSSTPISEQKKILSPCPKDHKRIVLSSSIAETSLTIPDVKLVIDSGLQRISKLNIATGINMLITQKESLFSSNQRTGRAGRTGPGRCIRLWSKSENLYECTPPEITRNDLTNLVLECAMWGIKDRLSLKWLTPPPESLWNSSVDLLTKLDCIQNGCITKFGKASLTLGIDVRLATLALKDKPRSILPFSSYKTASLEEQTKFINKIEERIKTISNNSFFINDYELSLISSFPDRLAIFINNEYTLYCGRKAIFDKNVKTLVPYPKWIIVTEALTTEKNVIIYSFVTPSQNKIEEYVKSKQETKIELFLHNNTIQKYKVTLYGKIELDRKKINAEPEDFVEALFSNVRNNGLKELPLNEKARNFLVRVKFYIQQYSIVNNKETTLKADDEYLISKLDEWLKPFVSNKTRIDESDVYNALYYYLDGTTIDKSVPEKIIMPNGINAKILYESQTTRENHSKLIIRPVIEIIIQRIFGCFTTPRIMRMNILIKLLSPAQRPLQITDDLENFWKSTWIEICKEMKGRYPKHNWDYRVTNKD